eukprot:scaffold75226_cov45-Cyclotella_meneghiniana.AAC.3
MIVPFNSSGCDSSITFEGSSLGPKVDELDIAAAAVPDRLRLLLVACSVVEFISLLTVGSTEVAVGNPPLSADQLSAHLPEEVDTKAFSLRLVSSNSNSILTGFYLLSSLPLKVKS